MITSKKNTKTLLFITLILAFCSLGFSIKIKKIKEFLTFQLISSVNSPQKTDAGIIFLKNQQADPQQYLEYLSTLDSLNTGEIKKYLQSGYAILDTLTFPDTLIIRLKDTESNTVNSL